MGGDAMGGGAMGGGAMGGGAMGGGAMPAGAMHQQGFAAMRLARALNPRERHLQALLADRGDGDDDDDVAQERRLRLMAFMRNGMRRGDRGHYGPPQTSAKQPSLKDVPTGADPNDYCVVFLPCYHSAACVSCVLGGAVVRCPVCQVHGPRVVGPIETWALLPKWQLY